MALCQYIESNLREKDGFPLLSEWFKNRQFEFGSMNGKIQIIGFFSNCFLCYLRVFEFHYLPLGNFLGHSEGTFCIVFHNFYGFFLHFLVT